MATVEELVNNLYEMVQDAGAVPFTDKCMLERDHVLDMLDELRVSLPADLKMAQDIVEKRNELIAAGKREADAMKQQAEEAAHTMVSETEVVKAARAKAKEILGNAEIQAAKTSSSAPKSRLRLAWARSKRRGSVSVILLAKTSNYRIYLTQNHTENVRMNGRGLPSAAPVF